MLRKITRSAMVLLVLCAIAGAARAADLKDPNQIIKKSWEHISSLNSYSYDIWGEGWEKDLSDIQNRTKNVAGEVADKYGNKLASNAKDAPKSSAKPKKMGYHVKYRFMKPYLLQMVVTQSDYVPKIIYGSVMTYRPDKDATIFFFKPKYSLVSIKRGIETESGTLLQSTMDMEFIEIEGLSKDAKPVLKGVKNFDGKDCYDIAFDYTAKKLPKGHAVDYKKWNSIPKEIRFAITKQAMDIDGKEVTSLHYLFDKKTLWLVGTEEYDMDGKLKYTKWFRNITENDQKEGDF